MVKVVYFWLQWVKYAYIRLHAVTVGYIWLQWVTYSYIMLHKYGYIW